MKKYIYSLFTVLFAAVAITSCSADEGTDEGNDPRPMVTLYQYSAVKPNNPDNDVRLRFATNNKVSELYYIVEKTTEKDAYVKANGEEAYLDYVVEKGEKLADASGASDVDITITGLFGEYTITAVAIGGGAKASDKAVFTGLDWEDVTTGTYNYGISWIDGASSDIISGVKSNPTLLQVCTTNPNLYRFKDVFGAGSHMKINLIDYKGEDNDGTYQFFRVPPTETAFTFGKYGTVSLMDIGYWQGADKWVTDNGYESGMYENHNCFICVAYAVAAGTLGFGYDMFIAD